MNKKFLFIFIAFILVLFFIGCLSVDLKHTRLEAKSKVIGYIASITINNLRPEKEGKDSWTFLGNTRNLYGMPVGFETREGRNIQDAFIDLFKNTLENAGYKTGKGSNKLSVDIINFYCDGYMGYSINAKIIVKLLSSQGKVLLSREIAKKKGFSYWIDSDIYKAFDEMMNYIAGEAVKIFKSSAFHNAMKSALH